MKQPRGFLTLPVVLSLLALLALGGVSAYWYMRHAEPQPSVSGIQQGGQKFFGAPATGVVPLTVTFTAEQTAGDDSIDFGDGHGTWEQCIAKGESFVCPPLENVTHTYTTPGTYIAKERRTTPSVVIDETTIVATEPIHNPNVSVASMSKYTDADFGFSFWYPSSKSVTILSPQVNSEAMYGAGTKVIKTIHAPEFSLDEVIAPSMSILSSVDAGCCGSSVDKYFFDPTLHTWMSVSDGGPKGGAGGTTPADVSKNTMGGLHILYGYTRFGIKVIIPLSATHFLAVYSSCNDATDYGCDWSSTSPTSGQNRFKAAIQTITATDPSVATPVSAAEQTKIIQAEKDAYAQ